MCRRERRGHGRDASYLAPPAQNVYAAFRHMAPIRRPIVLAFRSSARRRCGASSRAFTSSNRRPSVRRQPLLSSRGRHTTGVGARRRVDVAELGAVGKGHCHELPAIGAVTQWMNDGLDLHAGRECLRLLALPRQTGRSAHLDCPLLCLTLRVVHHHQDPAMGIGPLEILHGAFQGRHLFSVEHRKGMMRESRAADSQCSASK